MPVGNGVFEVRYGTALHTKVINAFKDRKRLGDAALALRSDKWADNENLFKAYLPESENDALRANERKNGRPQYTTIDVPYSYATLLTSHTYLTSIFLSRSPVLQMQGRHGESQNAEMAIEALLDYQLTVGGALPALYIWLLDPGKYGHGVLGHYWDEEHISSSQYVEEPVTFMGMPLPGKTKKTLKTISTPGYVGARHYNVRPQDFLFDPRLPLMRFQDGEFCIRFDQVGWNRIAQKVEDGVYYNVEAVKEQRQSQISNRDTGGSQTLLPNTNIIDTMLTTGEGKNPAVVNVHEFYFELIPNDYGLSPSKRPERWVFTIANESVVMSAQPLGFLHNKWPFDVLEYEIGGYELFNRSSLEITQPMNEVLTWLFNSHFYNVRKTLNDQFIVDPSMVMMKDLEDPNPGRLIRLKPAAYGKPVDSFIKQFQSVDITRSHISDADMVSSMLQRVSGVTDNIMGMVNQGGRKTATEVRTSTSFGVNRLKTIAEWYSACGFAPWAQKLVQTSQQMYELERKYRIVGDAAQFGERFFNVGPADIAGFYDFIPVDGTLPVDRFAQANLWQQILGGMQKMPQVAMAYDVPKIFAFVAQLAGLKNISQFRINVVPDGQALQGAQSGNSIPLGANMNEPGQIPGMGPTG